MFVLPVVLMTHACRLPGGALTLALAILAMLPRAIWISPTPTDAFLEIAATTLVSAFALWAMECQARQRTLHEEAELRLDAIGAVTAIVSQSLEQEQILDAALAKVLEVTYADAGLIYALDGATQRLRLVACRGLPAESAAAVTQLQAGDAIYDRVAQSAEALVEDIPEGLPALRREGLQTEVITPLTSRNRVQGVLVLATRLPRAFTRQEHELLAAIGGAIGVAVENAQLYASIRAYARQVIRIQEDERARIARELHDETIQMLIAISRRLELLSAMLDGLSTDARQAITALQALIRDTQRGLRRVAQGLHPPALEHLGLVPATRGLVNGLKEEGLEARLEVSGETRRLAQERELALFRIAQEALTNVQRHAGASRVIVRLDYCPDRLRMTVRDDGCGFSMPQGMSGFVTAGRLGLTSMDERARSLGGTLNIESAPGRGTLVTVDVPDSRPSTSL